MTLSFLEDHLPLSIVVQQIPWKAPVCELRSESICLLQGGPDDGTPSRLLLCRLWRVYADLATDANKTAEKWSLVEPVETPQRFLADLKSRLLSKIRVALWRVPWALRKQRGAREAWPGRRVSRLARPLSRMICDIFRKIRTRPQCVQSCILLQSSAYLRRIYALLWKGSKRKRHHTRSPQAIYPFLPSVRSMKNHGQKPNGSKRLKHHDCVETGKDLEPKLAQESTCKQLFHTM